MRLECVELAPAFSREVHGQGSFGMRRWLEITFGNYSKPRRRPELSTRAQAMTYASSFSGGGMFITFSKTSTKISAVLPWLSS